MADGGRTGDDVVAREDERQRGALCMDFVQGPQPSGQGVLLPAARRLQLVDLAAKTSDLGLDPLDPAVETDHFLLLVCQAPIDLLELGQQRCLLPPRLRRLLSLLFQLLLGLFQLAPLTLQRIIPFLLSLCRTNRQHERQNDDNGPYARRRRRGDRGVLRVRRRETPTEATTQMGRYHRSGARASQPPNAPSNVPAATSSTRFTGERKSRAGTPIVTLRTGSRWGAARRWATVSASSASRPPISP